MATELVKKHKKQIIISFVLLALFFLSRLINLTIIPIFTDEAIYLRWAQIAQNDAAWRFISLTDGKQPLFVWLTMGLMKVIKEPLMAGRLVSVGAGLTAAIGIWLLSFLLFKKQRLAFWASFLYLLIPFYLLYDRMALMDSMVGAFSILALFLGVLLAKTLRLDVALILGAVLGGGVLTKTSGFFNIYLLPLTLWLFDWRDKKRGFNLLKWTGLAFLAVIISQLFYSILRLSPLFHMIAQKNATFVYPIKEWFRHPFLFFRGNLRGEINWLVNYFSYPVVFLIIISLVLIRKNFREKAFLFLWFLAPFVALALFAKILYPRFILFMTLPLLILAAWTLEEMMRRIKAGWLFSVFCFLFSVFSLYTDFQLLFDPPKAPIPKQDRAQYIDSWPAGYGIKEIVAFAKKEAQDKKIFIATEGTFGMFPASLELYLWDYPHIEIKGFWPVKEIPPEVLEKAEEVPTFFVFNETQKIPKQWPLKLVAQYSRPDPHYSMKLYRVLSSNRK